MRIHKHYIKRKPKIVKYYKPLPVIPLTPAQKKIFSKYIRSLVKKVAIKNIISTKKKVNSTKSMIQLSVFMSKLFNSFIFKGRKSLIMNYFLRVLNIIKVRRIKGSFFKPKQSKMIYVYIRQISNKILPLLLYTNIMRRGKKIVLPWLRKNKKLFLSRLVTLSVSWIKKSVYARKEKTLFLKIFSELESIRVSKGNSMLLKKAYYKNFYDNKHFIKFMRKKKWI